MTAGRAICVSRDRGVRRVVEEALGATGVVVEHRDALPGDARGATLVVVDREARRAAGDALRALAAPVVVVGDDLDDDALIEVMRDAPVSHLVEDPGDRDLEITSYKLASGDVFGVEKYLAAGAEIVGRAIASDLDKRRAIGEVCAWAEARGARRPIVHRLASVVDELMMNALYDAPAPGDAGGQVAELRWGADAHVFAVSVTDRFGALLQRDVVDHVRRARSERGRPRPERADQRGAGLGLYLVASNVAGLVFNVEAGRRTEVVCLFDRAPTTRPAASAVRSLHVFRATAP